MPIFNLIDEPFIPCVRLDGRRAEYGLRDVLTLSHEIAEIHDPSPLITVSLHRLLLAIVHRVYEGPKDVGERIDILTAGAFDAEQIAAYLKKWADRFDLFHKEFPFYQRAGFKIDDAGGTNRLAQEQACNNNPTLFDHTTNSDVPDLTPSQAALAVICTQAFAISGGVSKRGNAASPIPNFRNGPLVTGAVVLIRGTSLFETLWLNLTTYDSDEKPIPCDEDDKPIWERDNVEPHTESTEPRGYLDYLTWQSRTLCLHPEPIGDRIVVRSVSFAQGRRLRTEKTLFDPMMAYARRDLGEPFYAVHFNEFRDLWRDSTALFQVYEKEQSYDLAPTCIQTIGREGLKKYLKSTAKYSISVSGLCTNSKQAGDVLFWRQEFLPIPLAYLDDSDRDGQLVGSLKSALKLAEEVNSEALRTAVWKTASARLAGDSGMTPDKNRVRGLIDSFAPDRLYWSQLERPYRELLVALAESTERDELIRDWFLTTLKREALEAFDTTFGRIDSGRDLKAVTAGRRVLHGLLKKLEPETTASILAEVTR